MTIVGANEPEAVRLGQVTSLARQAGVLAVVNMVNSALVVAVLWNEINSLLALAWMAPVWALSVYHGWRWWRGRDRGPRRRASERSVRKAVIQAWLVGLVWGVLPLVVWPGDSLVHQLFLIVVLGGMAIGSSGVLATIRAAAVGCVLLMVTPLIVRLFLVGETMYLALGLMGVMFVVGTLSMSQVLYLSFLRNVRSDMESRDLLQQVQILRADLEDAIASANEGFALFDENDRLVLCNAQYAELFPGAGALMRAGTTFEELLDHVIPPEDPERPGFAAPGWRADRLRRHHENDGPFIRKLCSGRWLQTSDQLTQRGGIVVTHVDITELMEREVALSEAKEQAEAASQAKSDFLALMSHELRTPLNAVIGFSEIIANEGFGAHSDARYAEYARDIEGSGNHLLQVINEILDLSKIEAGKFELYEQLVDIADLVAATHRILAERAERAGLIWRLELPDEVPSLTADPRTVRQMLLNLMSNAIKFTPRGGAVTTRFEIADDGLAVVIQDTGIGIAEEDLPRIMEPFAQAANYLTRNHSGTGLGLPLVNSLIELHRGSLKIESVVGQGTTVRLRFPPERLGLATSLSA